MSYAIGRPSWLPYTVLRSTSDRVHYAAGWNFLQGARAVCGRYLKEYDYWHVASFDSEFVSEFEVCTQCIRSWNRLQETGKEKNRSLATRSTHSH